MNAMSNILLLLCNILFLMLHFSQTGAGFGECFDHHYSPFCVCRSSHLNCTSNDFFFSVALLSYCQNDLAIRHCRQGHFRRPLFHLTDLIPALASHSHCLQGLDCLHLLQAPLHCAHCYPTLAPLSIQSESIHSNDLPTNSCLYLCPSDTSCGFFCLNENMTVSLTCHTCQAPGFNLTCRCMETEPVSSRFSSLNESTEESWTQKRGIPAAGFLVLLILLAVIFCIVIKLIYYQVDRRQSVLMAPPIVIHRPRQLSCQPSYAEQTQCEPSLEVAHRT